MYELRFHPKVDKELEKLPAEVRRVIRDIHLPAIAKDPYSSGIPLTGPLKGFHRRNFDYKGTSYRVAYEIDNKARIVYVLMVAKRESFYERLKRRTEI